MRLPGEDIEVGHHIRREVFGVAVNVDTVWSTLFAMAVVLGMGIYLARRASAERPGKLQLAWESVVGAVQSEVEANMGKVAPQVVPLAVALFFFILIANWIELVPTAHKAPAPTADVNLTYALALTVMGWATYSGIRHRGKAYFGHFTKPYKILLPLNMLEESIKPVTLALRLWGNIFAGGVMLLIIGLIPEAFFWLPEILWKLFDMVIGMIQAFIFALLTILYFGMALGGGEEAH